MRVRIDKQAIVPELAAFLRERGFLVVQHTGDELDVHLLNHVSYLYDRAAALAALEQWTELHPESGAFDVAPWSP